MIFLLQAFTKNSATKNCVLFCNINLVLSYDMNRIRTDFCFCMIQEQRSFYCLSSPYNTLYLELHCPAVAPSVVVTSDNGKNTVNFGDVAVGRKFGFKF